MTLVSVVVRFNAGETIKRSFGAMDDSWQFRACSNRPPSQHFPLTGSRNQIDMNFGQYSHPYVAQEVCVIERTIRQEPMASNTLNFGSPVFNSKTGRADLGNSFLALLSGPSQQFRSDYQQSSSFRSTVVSSNSPFYQIGMLENGAWPPLTASNASCITQTSANGGLGSGLESSQIAVSREMPASSYSRVTAYQDNFEPSNLRPHGPDVLKHGIRQSIPDCEVDLQASVPQWLTVGANLRQPQIQTMQSAHLPKTLTETGYSEAEQSSSVVKSRPRVFCCSTSGILSGELVLSDTGRLGVLCTCHNCHMSVAKFSEHGGPFAENPGTAVRMESGETIVAWRKVFFSQFGVKVPDDEKGWDWNDVNANEAGTAKYKTASPQNLERDISSSYQGDHSTLKTRIAQSWNNPVYRNNSYEGHVAQGLSSGGFVQNGVQKNMHEARETLLKNFSRVCKAGMPTSMNPQTLERLKDNLSAAPDVCGNISYRGSSNYGNSSVAEYIDFISNGGQPFISNQGTAGIKNFQKGFNQNRVSNIQDLLPREKDSMSSSFELRLGQPSQQTHALGGPLPSSLDSQVSQAALDRQKSLLYEHVMQRVCAPSVPEGAQQSVPFNFPGFSASKEKGKERQFDNQLHGAGRTNMMDSGCMDHIKGDPVRGSVMSMFLHSGGHPNSRVEEVPLQGMNRVVGDPEQLVNKLTQLNADCREGLRNRSMGGTNKGYPQSMEYGAHSNQSKIGMTAGPGIAFDTFASSASLFQMKQSIGNRLLHEVIPGQCLPLDVTTHNRQSLMNESQRTVVSPIEPDIRNRSSQMPLSSNFGSSDSPDAFCLRAIKSAFLKNSGPSLLSAAAQLNIPRASVATSMSRATDDVGNKLGGDACQMQHMTEDQLRGMHELRGGTQICKRNEPGINVSCQESEPDMSHGQVQLAGLPGDRNIQVQRNCAQQELRNSTSDAKQGFHQIDKHGLGNVFGNDAGVDQVRCPRDLGGPCENPGFVTGPSAPECNLPASEAYNPGNSQAKEVLSHVGCSKPNDRPLLRLGRLQQKCLNNPNGELLTCEQKDSNQSFVSEKVNNPGELQSPKSKEGSKTNAPVTESKQNVTSAALGTNSTVVVSVGENDSGAEKGSKELNQNVERHDIRNIGCQSFQWKEANNKVMAEAGDVLDESPVDLMDSRETVEDLLADTAAKGSIKGLLDNGSSKKEEQMSNVCSKSSDNVFSEFSDAGHVINEDICNVDSGGKKLMRSDVVDEGSGIGKCCSSDALDTGVWTRRKLASVSGDTKILGSPSPIPYPSSSDVKDASKVRSSLRLKRVHGSAGCTVAENELALQTAGRTGKLEKKRRTMKWKRLDATAPILEHNSKTSVPPNHARCTDSSFLPSPEVKAIETQCGTASVSSTPTRGSTLKRKRSALMVGNPSTSKHQAQEFQENRRKDEAVQQVQFKGDKLVIRLRQASTERKANPSGLDGVDRTGSRKLSKYAANCPEKNLSSCLPGDKAKLTVCGSSSALRIAKAGHGKPTSKTAKMVSLRSILKHPERHVHTQCKEAAKESSVTRVGNAVLNKSGGKAGKPSVLQRRQVTDIQDAFEASVHPKSRCNWKESSGLVNVKEVRKRSLWELTGKSKPGNKSAQFSSLGTLTQLTSTRQDGLPSAVGGKFNNHRCSFPRGERTLRVRFKCKGKGTFPKPNSTLSAGATNWFSANPYSPTNILSQSGGIKRPKICDSENGDQTAFMPVAKETHDVLKIGTIPMEEPLSLSTKAITRKNLNQISTFRKKEMEHIDQASSKVSKKQIRVDKKKKVGAYIDELPEVTIGSFAVQSGFKTAKMKKSSDGISVEKDITCPPLKRCRTENPSLGSNFEADVPCCVCGSSNEEGMNRLLQCGRCLIKVHQACYGVSKIPKSGWTCRACKANLSNIVCVLCGYGGGAMTRAQKTRNIVKGLLKVWQVTRDSNPKVLPGDMGPLSNKCSGIDRVSGKPMMGMSESNETKLRISGSCASNILSVGNQESDKTSFRSNLEDEVRMNRSQMEKVQTSLNGDFLVHNTITAAVNDPTVTQWVHMVCGLWMPGTRCLNVGTMGVFDVSGAILPRRKLVCSICKRPGGSCIQCRVVKCSVPFHPWCAHQKGLLQSEIEGDDREKVGFYGRCMLHAKDGEKHTEMAKSRDTLPVNPQSEHHKGTCARTEGYKGRKSWEESRAELRRQSDMDNTRVVSQEQINAWLHINERKSCTRGLMKPPNSDIKTDYRKEYLRFKQEQRWKRLVVYKSGIHALGLYTAEFISKGEMVVEYVGEIVGLRVADKREAAYHSGGKMQYEGACYFFRIDKESIIDATRKGGIARFVNHSCSPNCVAKVISVKSQKKVVFFAERDINAGEEVTYDYHFNHEDDGKKIPCFCNSKNCRRYLN